MFENNEAQAFAEEFAEALEEYNSPTFRTKVHEIAQSLFQSCPPLSPEDEQLRRHCKSALEFVERTCVYGSDNIKLDVFKTGSFNQFLSFEQGSFEETNFRDILIKNAMSVLSYRTGRCLPKSYLGGMYLCSKNIFQFDIFSMAGGNHYFLVAGLGNEKDLMKPESIPESAIVVDFWLGISYPAKCYSQIRRAIIEALSNAMKNNQSAQQHLLLPFVLSCRGTPRSLHSCETEFNFSSLDERLQVVKQMEKFIIDGLSGIFEENSGIQGWRKALPEKPLENNEALMKEIKDFSISEYASNKTANRNKTKKQFQSYKGSFFKEKAQACADHQWRKSESFRHFLLAEYLPKICQFTYIDPRTTMESLGIQDKFSRLNIVTGDEFEPFTCNGPFMSQATNVWASNIEKYETLTPLYAEIKKRLELNKMAELGEAPRQGNALSLLL